MNTVSRLPLLAGLLASAAVHAETLLHVDTSAPAKAPLDDQLRMGSSVSPSGQRLGINSQDLLLRAVRVTPVYRLSVRP